MKKIMIIFAAGALLTACSSTQDKEAAAEFCECSTITDGAGEATSFTEIMEAAQESADCYKKWQAKFDQKISADGFKSELKESCPEGFEKAEEMGIFE